MNPVEPIRLGFVGAGGICEQRHLPNLAKMPGVAIPCTKYRWARKKIISIGTSTATLAAISRL